MILVVGATGILGSAICFALLESGKTVRALVRADRDPAEVDRLRSAGAEIAIGDLTDKSSLQAASRGIEAVISTATSVSMRRETDNFETVDRQGHLDLIDVAKEAGTDHFVFMSFPPFPGEFPLQTAKRAIEEKLKGGALPNYTIIQAPHFREGWLTAPLGINPETGAMRTCGGGKAPISWIALDDVRDAVCASLDAPAARNKVLQIGGDAALSQSDVISRCEAMTGRSIEVEDTPHAQLVEMANGDDPLMRTFGGLMLVCADKGCEIDNSEASKVLAYTPRPLDDFLTDLSSSLPKA
ncbi:SDR family oxidoreductase [Roseibium denhamense]|uniref:Uncharacterized conserved protein YbjT, contains NAD(P)-binding and DUF2867 domains n=1 Tax=Roseibium denhamense TaxID=76305 RepID=A0ABY1NG64_9HYPH|nr:SDR family oxidoreductase [Roseibium denhamense]MTI06408.1 SDR family oxidoreductase [Roseibium denhamense]SMP08905.1 Uncharacterized conserved protein YbjT, contains NAD(P)-binding and DUF2867 domains [Roseibium denhamense]